MAIDNKHTQTSTYCAKTNLLDALLSTSLMKRNCPTSMSLPGASKTKKKKF
ncbi:unnamed protein product [Amoebophrya sp. A25]|nr:unnamed protein product [Amoebophrya sp. A25]|eukprot:GSA25T00006644001.1